MNKRMTERETALSVVVAVVAAAVLGAVVVVCSSSSRRRWTVLWHGRGMAVAAADATADATAAQWWHWVRQAINQSPLRHSSVIALNCICTLIATDGRPRR